MSNRPEPGQPCSHPGCLSHISHPCEGCGRVGGQPRINDDAFFASIDPTLAAIARIDRRRRETDFPWQGVTEDIEVVRVALNACYAALHLPEPRITWAKSPHAAFGALMYLRQMQTNMRQNVITQMVRAEDPLEASARAVFLESIMDKNLTVSMGASLKNSLLLPSSGRKLMPIAQIAEILNWKFTQPKQMPGWKDWALYPARCAFDYALQTQTFAILPFARAVWVVSPPTFIHTDEDGNLHCADGPAARWADGFEIYREQKQEEALVQLEAPAERSKGLSVMEQLKQLESPK